MKVLSYIELAKQADTNIDGSYVHYMIPSNICNDVNLLDGVLSFYSQPFRPELITELFEGWELIKVIDNYEFVFDSDKNNSINLYGEIEIILYGEDILLSKYWYPRTLDDFINDCQRAGIQLKWRAK